MNKIIHCRPTAHACRCTNRLDCQSGTGASKSYTVLWGQVLSYAGQKAGAEGVSRPCGFHYGKALVDARKKGGLTIFEIGTSAA